MKKALLSLCFVFILLAVFQNCGDIKLLNPQQIKQASKQEVHPMSAKVCLPQEAGIIFDLFGSPLIINVNAVQSGGVSLSDSDSDGVADADDKAPFDYKNSHTQNILDYICFKAGNCSSTCGGNNYFSLGLTRCDIQSYTVVSGGYNKFDSNTDAIPDFIQIIKKGDPFRSANTDLDQDGRILAEEIRDQTDPEWPDSPRADFRPLVTKIANDANCPGPAKHYSITTQNLPFVPVAAYTDPYSLSAGGSSFDLSHQANENVVGFFISTYSVNKTPATHRGYIFIGRITDSYWPTTASSLKNIDVGEAGFVKVEEWQ